MAVRSWNLALAAAFMLAACAQDNPDKSSATKAPEVASKPAAVVVVAAAAGLADSVVVPQAEPVAGVPVAEGDRKRNGISEV